MTGKDAFDQFDRELTDWLRDRAPGDVPDRVLDGALHRTARQPQRRGWLGRLGASSPAALVLRASAVAAVVVGAAVIGLQFANLTPAVSESPSPRPSPPPSSVPSASPQPVAGCPEPPHTFVTVTGVALEDRQACFGDQEMVLTGWVLRLTEPVPPCEAPMPKALAWLNCQVNQQPLAFGTLPPGPYQPTSRLLWIAADPEGPLGPMMLGAEYGQAVRTNTWVEVTGHFDDREARGCGYFASDPIRDTCEGTFVVTAVTELLAPWPMEALASSDCVTAPLDLLTLIFQTEPAVCFGSADIRIDTTMHGAGAIDGPCLNFEPAWLSCNAWVALDYVRPDVAATEPVVLAASRSDRPAWFAANVPSGGFPVSLFAALHPDSGITLEQVLDRSMLVTGHFDDPAALTCRLSEDAPPAFEMAPEEVVTSCRNIFVVTEVVPLD